MLSSVKINCYICICAYDCLEWMHGKDLIVSCKLSHYLVGYYDLHSRIQTQIISNLVL